MDHGCSSLSGKLIYDRHVFFNISVAGQTGDVIN